MANISYKGLFKDWEVGVAKNVIGKLMKQWQWLLPDEFEDLLQECLIHWVFVKDKYDPSAEASPQTFMAKVVKNKFLDIIKERERDKRKVIQNSVSLDQHICGEDDFSTLFDLIPDDELRFDNPVRKIELHMDLLKVVRKLTPVQLKICALLFESDRTITEVAEELGLRRKAVYREVSCIRAIFENEGLKNYLA